MLILAVIVLASVLASFSDWLFMDVLVHRFYLSAPEIWRGRGGRVRIVVSQIIATLASAGVVALCLWAPPGGRCLWRWRHGSPGHCR